MTTTYQKNGHIHGHYNPVRGGIFDRIGRDAASLFWIQNGYQIKDHDRDEQQRLVWQNTDLRVLKENKFINIEAAAKRANLFRYVRQGVDVETRKFKMTRPDEKSFVCMCDYINVSGVKTHGDEMLIIPMECLVAAQKDCGETYDGQRDVARHSGFSMPDHGCHRVRKRCIQGMMQTGEIEDFYRVPYEYVVHYRKNENGRYVLLHNSERKIKNG
jgi:hypothetical protein